MALDLTSPEKLRQYVTEKHNAASGMRQSTALRMGANACYSLGIQYLMSRGMMFSNSATGRTLRTSIDPDDPAVRVVWNELTMRTEKAAAATWPDQIKATVPPAVRNGGVEQSVESQIKEDLLLTWIDRAGYIESRRAVNHERAICGSYGLMLRQVFNRRSLKLRSGGEVDTVDKSLECRDFHPIRLILDPACHYRDLRRHEEVIYHDVYTAHELRRAFPKLDFREEDLKTVGQLTPNEQGIATLSGGLLFNQYARHSITKGARVYQIHAKDETGRWGIMYSAVELGAGTKDQDWHCTNIDNPVSPFGGDGFPMVLYHGHQRTGSPFGVGEVDMGKDAQNMMNLAMTQYVRLMQIHTNPRTYVEQRWMGAKVAEEDIRERFDNKVGGVVIGKINLGDKSANPPFTAPTPAFNPAMMEMVDRASQRLLDSSFRSALDNGQVKTHVPNSTNQQAQINSGQVLGIRVSEDVEADGKILTVALGTLIGNIQDGSPSTLAMLREAGFDFSVDIPLLLQADREYPTCGVQVSESFIRYRSADEKHAALMELANAPVPQITGDELRKSLADLNLAATPDDADMHREFEKAVTLVLQGVEWQPLPMKRYGPWLESLFERALMDRRCRKDPETLQRVMRALQAQQQVNVQVAISTNPEMVAEQQMAAQQQQADMATAQMEAQTAQQEAAAEQPAQPQNIGELVDMLAQPAA